MNHGTERCAVSQTTHASHEFLDARCAAEFLGVSRSYLAKLRMTPSGPVFCKFGRAVRYRRADLDAWTEDRRRSSTFESDRAD